MAVQVKVLPPETRKPSADTPTGAQLPTNAASGVERGKLDRVELGARLLRKGSAIAST
ncbi:hypothetical protein Br6_05064 [Rhodococcus sp. Br-6]|nr:hypothetical protein C8K36_1244 [Rhodococcus sp. OK519]GBF17657.1 hypothetical protein Br6_05064 [Rhodococcus sp. Br-6]